MDDVKEGYIPTRRNEIRNLKGLTKENIDLTRNPEEEEDMEQAEAVDDKMGISKGDEELTDSDDEEENKKKNLKIKKQLAEEKKELGKLIMNRKTKRLYNHLMKTKKGKWNAIAKLEAKRKLIEA